MSEKEIKRILLTTGYTTQTDKDAIYHYIKELKEVIEEIREYTNDKLFDDYTYCSYEDLKQNINEILDKVKEL